MLQGDRNQAFHGGGGVTHSRREPSCHLAEMGAGEAEDP